MSHRAAVPVSLAFPLDDLLVRLDPFQQRVVWLVYVDDHSPTDAARLLAVDRTTVVLSLRDVFRRVADWVGETNARNPLGVS